jgi:hypothetical protein
MQVDLLPEVVAGGRRHHRCRLVRGFKHLCRAAVAVSRFLLLPAGPPSPLAACCRGGQMNK